MSLKLPRSIDPENLELKSHRKGEFSPWFCQTRLASCRRRILLSSMKRTTFSDCASESQLSASSYEYSLVLMPELLSAFYRVSLHPVFFLILKSCALRRWPERNDVAEVGDYGAYCWSCLLKALNYFGCQASSSLGLGKALSGERHISSALAIINSKSVCFDGSAADPKCGFRCGDAVF